MRLKLSFSREARRFKRECPEKWDEWVREGEKKIILPLLEIYSLGEVAEFLNMTHSEISMIIE